MDIGRRDGIKRSDNSRKEGAASKMQNKANLNKSLKSGGFYETKPNSKTRSQTPKPARDTPFYQTNPFSQVAQPPSVVINLCKTNPKYCIFNPKTKMSAKTNPIQTQNRNATAHQS
jgi:hypothetical protein